jgi:hypothetical protein
VSNILTKRRNFDSEPDVALQFIKNVASLGIWDYDKDDGTPCKECDEPTEGHLDSHCCLMDLIGQARTVLKEVK